MMEYIKRLRICIKWFEGREDELVSLRDELQRNFSSLEREISNLGIKFEYLENVCFFLFFEPFCTLRRVAVKGEDRGVAGCMSGIGGQMFFPGGELGEGEEREAGEIARERSKIIFKWDQGTDYDFCEIIQDAIEKFRVESEERSRIEKERDSLHLDLRKSQQSALTAEEQASESL